MINDGLSFRDSIEGLNQKDLTKFLSAIEKFDEEYVDDGFRNDECEAQREFEMMIAPDNLKENLSRIKELLEQTNESERELLEDKINSLFNEVGIFFYDDQNDIKQYLSFQEAVYFSRRRNKNCGDCSLSELPESLEEFLAMSCSTGDNSGKAEISYGFSYPADYMWLTDFDEIGADANMIMAGGGYNELEKIDIYDSEDWPTFDISTLDTEVEIEFNFKKILAELDTIIGDGGFRMDIGLAIPLSFKYLLSSFEIRLIEFLIKHNVKPRISTSLFKQGEGSRTMIHLYYIVFKTK